ncbi:alanine racemase [Candidatus Galacturonibacter soehngenii]|uniref:Alanine racemase n=1 Tax=Candidatus Galacturonatibacter soehngenii TaxID=2307010 RepID=A0A7V7QMG8_9FIRM|nr:alanine racemase [Candidatus Galacturonibacter soehngenii]KAB1439856.1 alanine racemase [Candidatus Galacturonibacter soehngenii]MBA4685909.1 alanine racemase [Candidatus Galacturonibacter soehngenii]
MNQYNRVYATVNLDAVEFNIQQMKANIEKDTQIIAVIKADGYGHGAVPIARLIEAYEYIWGFAVATAEEAFELRMNQIKKPILILGYVFPEHYNKLVDLDIHFTVFGLEMARELSNIGAKQKKRVNIHLKLDTGMNRIGFQCIEESISTIKEINQLENISIEAVFTHFAKADEKDKESANKQLALYKSFVKKIEDSGITIPLKHCSNSASIIDIKEANMDAVRAGISIYGLYPSAEVCMNQVLLQPVLEWKSHIVHIKEVTPGSGISYGWTCITDKVTKVATIPVGYADGYPRSLSNKGWVLIRGEKAKILGRVCMDQFMVDVTDIKGVQLNDEVVLIGKSENESILVEEMSEISGRFNYEFVCDIGKRVPRIFLRNNKVVETKDYYLEF